MHVELLYFLPLTNLTFPYQYRQVRESIRVDSKLDLIQLSEDVCRAYTSQQLLCSVQSSAAQSTSP